MRFQEQDFYDRDHTAKFFDFDNQCKIPWIPFRHVIFAYEFLYFEAAQCGIQFFKTSGRDHSLEYASIRIFNLLVQSMVNGIIHYAQRKNPDAAELVRAKTGRLNGNLIQNDDSTSALP